jgi:DNA-binding NarL/FixJ family response regulator
MAEANITDWKALIVDDHMFFRQQLHDMLHHTGFRNIDQASNVTEAQDKLGANTYDVVFLDLHMPGRSGFNFLQSCREDTRFDAMAFIVVSAESEEHYVREAMKAGATCYMVKPVLPAALKKNLDKVAEWRELQLAHARRSKS